VLAPDELSAMVRLHELGWGTVERRMGLKAANL